MTIKPSDLRTWPIPAALEGIVQFLGGQADQLAIIGSPVGTPAANTLYKDNICRAWGYFNAVTPATLVSFNVTSITRTGTGVVAVVLDRDMASANYVVLIAGEHNNGTAVYWTVLDGDVGLATTGFTINILNSGSAFANSRFIFFAVYGEQA